MKIKSILVLLMSFSFLLTSCSQKTNTSETPIPTETESEVPVVLLADYFPLTKGDFWKYLGDGNEYASFTREVIYTDGIFTGIGKQPYGYGSSSVFYLTYAQISEENGGTVISSVYHLTNDEITCVYFKGEEYNKEYLIDQPSNCNVIILKAPLEIGTTWVSGTDTREIISLDASVITPLGEMTDCIMVKITDENSYTYEYFKKDIGLIKREFHSGETIISSTLEEMNLSD